MRQKEKRVGSRDFRKQHLGRERPRKERRLRFRKSERKKGMLKEMESPSSFPLKTSVSKCIIHLVRVQCRQLSVRNKDLLALTRGQASQQPEEREVAALAGMVLGEER
jgi:hypothetical protein